MGVKIVRGSRSEKYAAKDWKCVCGHTNKVKHFLIFDLPSFYCEKFGCKKTYDGIVYFNLADVEVNGRSIIPEVKDQGGKPQCAPYAFCHAQELNDAVEALIMSDDSAIECLDPTVLDDVYRNMFLDAQYTEEDYGYMHKLIYTGMILKERNRGVVKGQHSDCFPVCYGKQELICQCIADGRGVVGCFSAGKKLAELEFGQVYCETEDPKAIRHAVVLIGAIFYLKTIIYIFLNSWGKGFCAIKNANGEIITGGIGMIQTRLSCNPIVLTRSWEEVLDGKFSVAWKRMGDMSSVELSEEIDQLMEIPGRTTFINKNNGNFEVLGPYGEADDAQDSFNREDIIDADTCGNIHMLNIACTACSFYGNTRIQDADGLRESLGSSTLRNKHTLLPTSPLSEAMLAHQHEDCESTMDASFPKIVKKAAFECCMDKNVIRPSIVLFIALWNEVQFRRITESMSVRSPFVFLDSDIFIPTILNEDVRRGISYLHGNLLNLGTANLLRYKDKVPNSGLTPLQAVAGVSQGKAWKQDTDMGKCIFSHFTKLRVHQNVHELKERAGVRSRKMRKTSPVAVLRCQMEVEASLRTAVMLAHGRPDGRACPDAAAPPPLFQARSPLCSRLRRSHRPGASSASFLSSPPTTTVTTALPLPTPATATAAAPPPSSPVKHAQASPPPPPSSRRRRRKWRQLLHLILHLLAAADENGGSSSPNSVDDSSDSVSSSGTGSGPLLPQLR